MVGTIIRIKENITKESGHSIRVHQNYFHRQVCTNTYGIFYIILLHNLYNQHYKQKMTDAMKEKLNPVVEEYRRINTKPK